MNQKELILLEMKKWSDRKALSIPAYIYFDKKRNDKCSSFYQAYAKLAPEELSYDKQSAFLRSNDKFNSLAVLCGKRSNLIMIDIDIKKKTLKEQIVFVKQYDIKPTADHLLDKCPNGGLHLYYQWDDRLDNVTTTFTNMFEDNSCIDIRGNGGLSFVGGSRYRKKDGEFAYWDARGSVIPKLPEIVIQYLLTRNAEKTASLINKVDTFDLSLIKDACQILSEVKTDYTDWRNVMFALHTVGQKDLFISMSLANPHFKDTKEHLESCWQSVKDDKDTKITIASLYDIAQKYGWKNPCDDIEIIVGTESAPKSGDPVSNVSGRELKRLNMNNHVKINLMHNTYTEVEKVKVQSLTEEGYLIRGEYDVIYGADGVNKTWLTLDMIRGLVNGKPFWDGKFTPSKPLNVLYVHTDKTFTMFNEYYIKAFGKDDKIYHHPNLRAEYTRDLTKHANEIHPSLRMFDITDKIALMYLRNVIVEYKSDILIIDTLAGGMLTKDFNKKEDLAPFLNDLRDLISSTKIACLLIHHANKTQAVSKGGITQTGGDSYQGPRIFSALANTTIRIARVPDTDLSSYVYYEKKSTFSMKPFVATVLNSPPKVEEIGDDLIIHDDYVKWVDIVITDMEDNKIADDTKLNLRSKILRIMRIRNGSIHSNDLRDILNVGTHGGTEANLYNNTIKYLLSHKMIKSDGGKRNHCEYTLTPEGLTSINVRYAGDTPEQLITTAVSPAESSKKSKKNEDRGVQPLEICKDFDTSVNYRSEDQRKKDAVLDLLFIVPEFKEEDLK